MQRFRKGKETILSEKTQNGEHRIVEKQGMSEKHWRVLEPQRLLAKLNPSKLLTHRVP